MRPPSCMFCRGPNWIPNCPIEMSKIFVTAGDVAAAVPAHYWPRARAFGEPVNGLIEVAGPDLIQQGPTCPAISRRDGRRAEVNFHHSQNPMAAF